MVAGGLTLMVGVLERRPRISRRAEAHAPRPIAAPEPTGLFALAGALAWLGEQPTLGPRADHLFDVITRAILTSPAGEVRARR
jgi:hypothetical protein